MPCLCTQLSVAEWRNSAVFQTFQRRVEVMLLPQLQLITLHGRCIVHCTLTVYIFAAHPHSHVCQRGVFLQKCSCSLSQHQSPENFFYSAVLPSKHFPFPEPLAAGLDICLNPTLQLPNQIQTFLVFCYSSSLSPVDMSWLPTSSLRQLEEAEHPC